MKTFFIYFLLLIITCGCNSHDETIETQLFSCIEAHYADQNIELASALDSLENYFVSKKILSSTDGEAKIKFYEAIVKTGEVPGIERTALMERIADNYYSFESALNCLFGKKDFDSVEYYESKFYLVQEKMKNEMTKYGELSLATASKAILSNLSSEDFERPFYRAHMLISYVMTADRESAFVRKVPKSTTVAPYMDDKGFVIDLNSDGQVELNGKKFYTEDLESELYRYFFSFDETTHVRIICSPSTEYQDLARANLTIERAYEKFCDRVALREYWMEFEKLEASKQNDIKTRYSLKIVEVVER